MSRKGQANDSSWRWKARKVIRETLADLPDGASPTQAEDALDAAYPFGRKSHHPYRVWREERRRALADHFSESQWPPLTALAWFRLDLRTNGQIPAVECAVCNGDPFPGGGCLGCCKLREYLRTWASQNGNTFYLMLRDEAAAPMREDMLKEGFDGFPARWIRPTKATKQRPKRKRQPCDGTNLPPLTADSLNSRHPPDESRPAPDTAP